MNGLPEYCSRGGFTVSPTARWCVSSHDTGQGILMCAVRIDAGRRFFCRALPAAVAVWGLLWAGTVQAYQPAKAETKAEAKEEEKTYEFAMNGKPWKDV